MSGTRRVLLVIGCMVCLLAVASTLPAADPRLDVPGAGGGSGGETAGDWDSIVESDQPPEESESDDPDDGDEDAGDDGEESSDDANGITISGAVEPGNEVTVDVDDADPFDPVPVAVDGQRVGEVEIEGVTVEVPFAEEMTVSLPEDGASRTVDVRTDARLVPIDAAAPDRDLTVRVSVGTTAVPDATISRDGDAVATTDGDGEATVPLPETAGPTDLRAERGPVTGERTVEVPEPSVRLLTPLLIPGAPAPVEVSADGAGVEDAVVSVEDGGQAVTDADGRAWVSLPIADEATVTADVGAETATTSVGDLYLRLTAVVVLVPGFLVGGVYTYGRLAARRDRRQRASLLAVFVALADALGALSERLGALVGSWPGPSRPRVGLPDLSFPRVSLPDVSWPGAGSAGLGAVRSLGAALTGLGSGDEPTRRRSLLPDWFGGSDDEADDALGGDADGPADAPADETDEGTSQRGPRAEVRAAWHAFCDRVGVEDRETRTPGQVARRALSIGFPPAAVRRLVATFRQVEYGGRDPTTERVAEARAATEILHEADPDEEGSE